MSAPSLPLPGNTVIEEDLHLSRVTFWSRLRRHKLAIAGLVVLSLMVLAAVFAKQLAPFDPNAIDNVHWQGTPLPPCFQDASQCGGHLLGIAPCREAPSANGAADGVVGDAGGACEVGLRPAARGHRRYRPRLKIL